MAELSPVSWIDLIQGLRKLGFDGPHQVGKHPFMIRGNVRLSIPNQHHREIGAPLLSRILRRAGVSNKAWLEK